MVRYVFVIWQIGVLHFGKIEALIAIKPTPEDGVNEFEFSTRRNT